jgi:hypothetical protein
LLLSLLVIPIAAIITLANNADPLFAAAAFFITVVGGLLRMAYAATFESGEPGSATIEDNVITGIGKILRKRRERRELTAAPANAQFYAAPPARTWLDTNELAAPPASVTDNTTKLLKKDDQ